jgi:hypothetical protein
MNPSERAKFLIEFVESIHKRKSNAKVKNSYKRLKQDGLSLGSWIGEAMSKNTHSTKQKLRHKVLS